ncbi:hypothetical protein Y032_0261g542 [Ancylostoma ceylanicum]|uniref:Uncharacterized protein n=1 Tax=Ancylostoma ceylanicum TaxID=53326 RepID=A0A016SA34_9BILA|nr:hypothetical protein Y032_0261g542 [Ancylostoma ceylanicum]
MGAVARLSRRAVDAGGEYSLERLYNFSSDQIGLRRTLNNAKRSSLSVLSTKCPKLTGEMGDGNDAY